MTETLHPAAGPHMPWFLPGPDGSDTLLTFSAISLIGAIALLGVLFFTIHTLPERLGHKKLQFEIVAVLGLLSLFTHIHLFWVAGLLLALIDLPDFSTPLGRISGALERMAGNEAAKPQTESTPLHVTPAPKTEAA